jgi:hypothetical protein
VTGCPASSAADSAAAVSGSGSAVTILVCGRSALIALATPGRQAAAVRDYDRVRVRQIFEDLQADRPVPAITPAPWTCACRESRPRL